jgi:predicted TIM-barrel fold metal-dependent hydrolase
MAVSSSSLGLVRHINHKRGGTSFQSTVIRDMKLAVIGSDYPLPAGLAHPVAEVKALGLEPEAESAVLGGNASRLLRLTS